MKTRLQFITDLPESHKWVAWNHIKPGGEEKKFRTLRSCLLWTLPAGSLRDKFWSQLFTHSE